MMLIMISSENQGWFCYSSSRCNLQLAMPPRHCYHQPSINTPFLNSFLSLFGRLELCLSASVSPTRNQTGFD
uniref:Uncharacterized protein n=1 Tax=Rhizophora mucronata TaxID=61149 RepID=A0A2P2LD40_RHIMU